LPTAHLGRPPEPLLWSPKQSCAFAGHADESAPALCAAAVVTLNLTSSVAVGHDPVPGTVSRIVALPVTHTCGVKLPLAGVIVAVPLTSDEQGRPPEPLPCATKQYCPSAEHADQSPPAAPPAP